MYDICYVVHVATLGRHVPNVPGVQVPDSAAQLRGGCLLAEVHALDD